MKYKDYYCELYFCKILFIWGAAYEEVQRFLDKKFERTELRIDVNRSYGGGIEKYESGDGEDVYIIWIEKKHETDLLVHEVTHLVHEIFKDRDISVGYDNQEPFCYYQAMWFLKFYNEMHKRKKK